MQSPREIFAAYAGERRRARIPGFEIEVLDDVTRHRPTAMMGDEALVVFARFSEAHADARIREELARFREHGWEGEWKVHDFDEPADIKARLEALGLKAHHAEALLVLDLATALLPEARDDRITIDRATGSALDEIAAFQEEIWSIRLPWLADVMHAVGDPVNGTGLVFRARDGERLVGCGWLELHRGSPFVQLSGGAVHEAYRGRGIYSRLLARRVAEARARDARWMAVEAAPMSRPILEKKGFRFICHTYPLRTRPYETTAVTRS